MAKKPTKKPATKAKVKAKAKTKAPAKKAAKPGNPGVLTEEARTEIVIRLAMWDKPKDIHADLIERGFDITQQAIGRYNPYNVHHDRAAKWKVLFDKTREDFLAGIVEIPIASRSYRLRRLQEVLMLAMRRGATAEARAALEQAAKEVGDVFTNKTKLDAPNLPMGLGMTRTDDEARNMLADRLGEALRRLPAPKSPTIQ